jgi:hypothetical protein
MKIQLIEIFTGYHATPVGELGWALPDLRRARGSPIRNRCIMASLMAFTIYLGMSSLPNIQVKL